MRPVGDAVCEDGTLKDASEMEWPHSASEHDGPKLYEMSEWKNSGKTKSPDSPSGDHSKTCRKHKHDHRATSELETSASEPNSDEPCPAKVRVYCDLDIDFLIMLQSA